MIYLISIVALIVADQWSKYWAIGALMNQPSSEFIKGFLGFRYTENTGAAFSILRDQQLLLILLTFLILAGMAGYLVKAIRTDAPIVVKIAFVFVIAGAIGNFIDRVRLNFVVDFLEFKFIDFPIFNIADVCVVVGVILLAFSTIFLKYDF